MMFKQCGGWELIPWTESHPKAGFLTVTSLPLAKDVGMESYSEDLWKGLLSTGKALASLQLEDHEVFVLVDGFGSKPPTPRWPLKSLLNRW